MLFLLTLIVCVALAVYGVGFFNALHERRVACDNAFARIAVQLQRRYELFANLARSTQSHHASASGCDADSMDAVGEQAIMILSAAPGRIDDRDVMTRLADVDNEVTVILGRLSSLIERKPSLRADDELALVREELISTENKIAFARRAFNDAVIDYETRRGRFPGSWLASLTSLRSLLPFGATSQSSPYADAGKALNTSNPNAQSDTGGRAESADQRLAQDAQSLHKGTTS